MKKPNKQLCTIIPLYKHALTPVEEISLKQYDAVLGDKYDVFFILPEKLDVADALKILPYAKLKYFDNKFFDGIEGYNRLCLSSLLYKKFSNYKYMLIYQTDAFIFYNRLDYFVKLDFDFYGPPLEHMENEALCGGFSMRKIDKCLRLTQFFEQEDFNILRYKKSGFKNEDIFFSLNLPQVLPYHLSCMWGWNSYICYKKHLRVSNNMFPMGIHGFKNKELLKPISKFLKVKIE